jgi:hypothetical protein
MMYSFGARNDCAVVDEPFYSAYLAATGVEHPMQDEILASQPRNPDIVVQDMIGKIPDARSIFYQKHMAHHMLGHFDLGWMSEFQNVFLLRHPNRVVASYAALNQALTLDDVGFEQLARLYEQAKVLGQKPAIIDSFDIRANPKGMLQKLCSRLKLPWDAAMLNWPTGGNTADGVWAAHWYKAVHRSTGFAGPEGDLPLLTGAYAEVAAAAMPYYETLKAAALEPI